MKKYIRASAIWYFICFLFTTFISPLLGWSDNGIGWSQIIINFFLWPAVFGIVIYIEKKRIKKA